MFDFFNVNEAYIHQLIEDCHKVKGQLESKQNLERVHEKENADSKMVDDGIELPERPDKIESRPQSSI